MATLSDILSKCPGGLNLADLLVEVRRQNPSFTERRLLNSLKIEIDSGSVIQTGDLLRATVEVEASATVDQPSVAQVGNERRPMRLVAFDLESVVRPTELAPYARRDTFQIGAVRFGNDSEWVNSRQFFSSFVRLPADAEPFLQSQRIRSNYQAAQREPRQAWQKFLEFIYDADALLAYNGTLLDFGLLHEELGRHQLVNKSKAVFVDGLYLAHAIWPIPPRQHRLKQLLEKLNVDVGDREWHEADDDAVMLRELLIAASQEVERWEPELRDLVVSVSDDSNAWRIITELMGYQTNRRLFDSDEIADLVRQKLDRTRHRAFPELEGPVSAVEPPAASITIPDELFDLERNVDVRRLASAAKGSEAEPRPSQEEMVRRMRSWISEETGALVEAPTGTGKSFAMLAIALEWLAADANNRVVISTFTKQLQSQIAADVQTLSELVPELAEITDLVKGSRNRLSLLGLITRLAELTQPRTVSNRRRSSSFDSDPRFRELAIYLLLRLIADGALTDLWESKSVDPVDLPPFFRDYCGWRFGMFLEGLSQAQTGEYKHLGSPLRRYSLSARESIDRHRLIIANHALLLAHSDAFLEAGPRTLVMVDEAHSLESAATQALSFSFDLGSVEDFAQELDRFVQANVVTPDHNGLLATSNSLRLFLEDEQLPRASLTMLSTTPTDPLQPAQLRRVTVASPFSGNSHGLAVAGMADAIGQLRRLIGDIAVQLSRFAVPSKREGRDDFFVLNARLAELRENVSAVSSHLHAILRTGEPPLAAIGSQLSAGEGDDEPTASTDELDRDEGVLRQDIGPQRNVNRVVWIEELSPYSSSTEQRWYKVRVTSSPIELGREPKYREFRDGFPKLFLISATLRVDGRWQFMRDRLALSEQHFRSIELTSPFDLQAQALLVCFSDFPSWVEQKDWATRTVAHQVTGFLNHVAKGPQNGAMVLTTARSTAAAIALGMMSAQSNRSSIHRIHSTEIEGNQRGVENFKATGGALVGTKGLWQGVDIANPERLRLVWINKLPFASFADPIIAARRASVAASLDARRSGDPDRFADETYYLPLAAIELRQAIGRLIRSRDHRGVVILSDRKLAGVTRQRRLYRRVFLGSLDDGFVRDDGVTSIVSMEEGWARIWEFLGKHGVIDQSRVAGLSTGDALEEHAQLPEARRIRALAYTLEQVRKPGEDNFATWLAEFLARSTEIGQLLKIDGQFQLRAKQVEALKAVAGGHDLLAVLPTGYGKSFVFQLPALLMPGVTIVVSPLVSLMTDQALELNRSIGGAVRALVAPMRESNSRAGKAEVHEQLTNPACAHGIRLVYLSPERLCQRQFQGWIAAGVELGIVRRIAIDEAHTFAQWGDDFRPSFRRAEQFIKALKENNPSLQLIAVTATANAPVRRAMRRSIFGLTSGAEQNRIVEVSANALRPDLAMYRRSLGAAGREKVAALVESVVDNVDGHAILYCMTVKEVESLYAHLSDYLGDEGRLIKYHGRLTDIEKAGAADRFRSAPKKGEEDFIPLIVIATSAFGLGIDRSDIRTVFVVSPPTDLAALYQQLGRAGRDRMKGGSGEPSFALALCTNRGFQTVEYMTRGRENAHTLLQIAATQILNMGMPLRLDTIAQNMAEDRMLFPRRRASADEMHRDFATARTLALSALAELGVMGQVEDLGDYPEYVAILPGEFEPTEAELAEFVHAIRDATVDDKIVSLPELFTRLGPLCDRYAGDQAALWFDLLEMQTLGFLDISQSPNIGRGQLTSVRIRSRQLPTDFGMRLRTREQITRQEVQDLKNWFEDRVCVNDGWRRYFGEDEMPVDTCSTSHCRCSTCWDAGRGGNDEERPPLLKAFFSDGVVSRGVMDIRERRGREQLDRYVETLLRQNQQGLSFAIISSVLKGQDSYFNKSERRMKPLWPRLMNSKIRGARPNLNTEELIGSIQRLQSLEYLDRNGGLWCWRNQQMQKGKD